MSTAGSRSTDHLPLLPPNRRLPRRPSLGAAARFLRRVSSRRMMREPSMLVRESAVDQLDERQSDWAYSRPVVFLDILWNLSFVTVAAGVLILSMDESPPLPLRLWIVGYAAQCLLHILCVSIEYVRRARGQFGVRTEDGAIDGGAGSLRDVEGRYIGESLPNANTRIAKHLESANTMFSFIWWIIGFYWVSAGGQDLTRDSPQLYWLCIVFLAFDVFFVVFCVALACIVGIAVCCCLPCIIAILYAVADPHGGASDEDIRQLPKYKFRRMGDPEKFVSEISGPCSGIMSECGTDSPIEHVLSAEDADCCICISPYDDGVELRELPCSHHFHAACIEKWLRINAICPLCKFNILKTSDDVEEV